MKKLNLTEIVSFNRYRAMIFATATLIFSYWFFIRTGLGQTIDTLGMFALHFLNKNLSSWEYILLTQYFWVFLVVQAAIIAFIILYRRVYQLGFLVLAMGVSATIATQILKHHVLDRPSLGITYYISNSFPSGHTTTACVLAVAFVMVSADRWKNIAAVLATLLISPVAIAVIVARWHRGSDILGAILVVLIMVLAFYNPGRKNIPYSGQTKITGFCLRFGFLGFAVAVVLMAICCIQIHLAQIDKNIGLAFNQIVEAAKTYNNLAMLAAVAVTVMVVSMTVILNFTAARIGQKTTL